MAVLIVGLAWFGRSAWGGHVLVDDSPRMDVYHLATLYERWAHHWASGHVPAWMPELSGGYPAPASWMYGLWYPGLLLFGFLPADAAWTWTALLHLAIGAVGVHRLVRAETGDDVAGATAGLLFGLSELMVGRVLCGHLNVTMPLAWAPWVFLHVRGIAAGRRGAVAWAVVCAAACLLAGHVQVAFYVVPAVLVYAVVVLRGTPSRAPVARGLIVAALLVVLVTAVQWLPALELFSLSARTAQSTTDLRHSCAPAHVLVAKLFPGVLGHPPTAWGPAPWMHELGAVGGLLIVALAVPALARRGAATWTWAGIAAAGLLLAPGVLNPVSALLNELPPVRFGRTPARALLLVTLAGAILAGRGLAEWRRIARDAPEGLRLSVVRAALATSAVGAVGAVALFVLLRDAGIGDHGQVAARAMVSSAVLAAGALVIPLVARTQPRAWLAVPALAVATAVLGGAPPARSVRSDFYFTDWKALIPAEMQEHRLHLEDGRFPNVERQGLRTLREICYVDARWYHDFLAQPGPRRAAWLDVGADLGTVPRERLMAGALTADDLVGRTLPTFGAGQVFATARAEPDDARVLAALDAGEHALFLAEPADGAAEGPALPLDGARVTRVGGGKPTETRFDVASPAAGWLVVAEKHFPGWTATVDGADVPIHRANVTFRAVQLPAGRSAVVFVYAPWTLRIGSLLCALGLIATLVGAWRSRRG